MLIHYFVVVFDVLAGFLWKDKSDDGVRSILEKGLIPLDRLLIETDAPFMYPNVRGSKIPANIKQALSERFACRPIH